MQAEILARRAYEADCAARAFYHDGTRRKTWDELGAVARWSWVRNPTPRWQSPATG